MSPRLVKEFQHKFAYPRGNVDALQSDHLAHDLPLVNVVQFHLVAGAAHVLSRTRSALMIHPGHPFQGNPVLELKILKGIVDEIISTGPL